MQKQAALTEVLDLRVQSFHVCVFKTRCVHNHGKAPIGKMYRALCISKLVSKMMTRHVAFGKLRTALFALPYYTKQTVTACHSPPSLKTQTGKTNILWITINLEM